MAKVELIMPKMGESIMEATILKWLKKEGDTVEADETVLEIATDKVDSEVPSPVSGKIVKILYPENETVAIGQPIAIIETEAAATAEVRASPALGETTSDATTANGKEKTPEERPAVPQPAATTAQPVAATTTTPTEVPRSAPGSGRFYSPLVRNIAKQEGISLEELEQIKGTGMHGRVTKKDILNYLEQRRQQPIPTSQPQPSRSAPDATPQPATRPDASASEEIIEMDRMRKLIAEHMVRSKATSPHVTSFVEADVTNIVLWRNRVKETFQQKYGEKITFTPIFIEAVVRAIHDFPMINVSVDGDKIIKKNYVHIGMATALPNGNLIVPVIKHADELNLVGLTRAVNDLARRARANQLKPEEIQGGTFTLTNVGTFGNVMGTPIINQPQVAILATGAIRKKPAVVETEYGDLIAVRHMMFLSLSYDHRVVDGYLGGSFLRRVADYLESFDKNRPI